MAAVRTRQYLERPLCRPHCQAETRAASSSTSNRPTTPACGAGGAASPALAAVNGPAFDAPENAAPAPSPKHLARHRRRRLHRLAPGRSPAEARPAVVGLDNFATGHQHNLDEVQASVGPERWAQLQLHRGDIRDLTTCRARLRGRRLRAAPGGARLGAALARRSAPDPRSQRHRLPQHAGGRARRQGQALRLRRVQLDLRRPPRPAQGRGRHRQAAVALCGDQAT